MDRFAQAKACVEEGCGEVSVGRFSGKTLCKNHLMAYMNRAKQEIPVADQGIQNSEGPERLKYERFKQVMKTQIDQGGKSLLLDNVNDKLQLFEKGSAKTSALWDPSAVNPINEETRVDSSCPQCEDAKVIKVPCTEFYCNDGRCSTCDGVGQVRDCGDEECHYYYPASPEDGLEHECHDCYEGECEYCLGAGNYEVACPECSKTASLFSETSDEAADADAAFIKEQEEQKERQENSGEVSIPELLEAGGHASHQATGKAKIKALSKKESASRRQERLQQKQEALKWVNKVGGPYTPENHKVYEFPDGYSVHALSTYGDLGFEGYMMNNCLRDEFAVRCSPENHVPGFKCDKCEEESSGVHYLDQPVNLPVDDEFTDCLDCDGDKFVSSNHSYISHPVYRANLEDFAEIYSLRNADGIPVTTWYETNELEDDNDIVHVRSILGRGNTKPKPEYMNKIKQYMDNRENTVRIWTSNYDSYLLPKTAAYSAEDISANEDPRPRPNQDPEPWSIDGCSVTTAKTAQVSADHEHNFDTGDVPGTFRCSCGLEAWYDRNARNYNVELRHDPHNENCDIVSGSDWNELKDNLGKRVAQAGAHCYICGGPVSKNNGVSSNINGRTVYRHKNLVICDEYKEDAYYAEPDSVLDDSEPLSIISSNIVCAMCGDDWDTNLLDHNKVASLVDGNGCPTCDGAPLCMGCVHKFAAHNNRTCGADEIRFDRRLAAEVVAQCECNGYSPLEISYYDEHLASKIAAIGDRVVGWPAEAQPKEGEGYPPRSDDDIEFPGQDHPDDDGEGGNDNFPGKDILEGVAHGQDHLRQYKATSAQQLRGRVDGECSECGSQNLVAVDWDSEPIVRCEDCEAHHYARPLVPDDGDDEVSVWGIDRSRSADGRVDTDDKGYLVRTKRYYEEPESRLSHDVPVRHIVDHLGELATGVEPATCKFCGQAMELHAQWAPTKQTSGWRTVKNAAFGREDVPATFIVDHLAQLAIGVEPATCSICGEAMSRHAQWLPTKQASDDSFTPPSSVSNAAKRGLKLRKEHGRGGTEVGVARARDLSNRKGLSYDTVKRMKAYFDRHEVDKQGEGWGKDSAGYIAWLLWGGDSGRSWANKIVKQKEREKKSSVEFFGWNNHKLAAHPVGKCRKCGSTELNRPVEYDSTGMSLCQNCGAFNQHI